MAPVPAMATLVEELVEEVILRRPPDDPAGLVRAALVCRRWRRLVSDPGFHRRFRELHRTPPMLGFLVRLAAADGVDVARFLPTSSFRAPRADRRGLRALDSRHGRVLLHADLSAGEEGSIVVWDPVTDEQRDLPVLPECPLQFTWRWSWNAAVLCASPGCGHGHLHCRGGPFHVVFVATTRTSTFLRVYSSEAGDWSEPAIIACPDPHCKVFAFDGRVVMEDAVYFKCYVGSSIRILKYNVATRGVSVIGITPKRYNWEEIVLMASEDGRLGFAALNCVCPNSQLHLWLTEVGTNGDVTWTRGRVVELRALLPAEALATGPHVSVIVDDAEIVLMGTAVGFFMMDLKSGQIKKVVGEGHHYRDIVPYMSFCTPALGETSTGERPGAGA